MQEAAFSRTGPGVVGRRLGFAVKVLGEGGLPSHDTRRWQSEPHLSVSLTRLLAVFEYLRGHDIRMYRMASALVPYATHPELPQFHHQLDECAEQLAEVGEVARRDAVRLSTHPGQYTVLNSTDADVRVAAIRDLEAQARLFDAMGLPPEALVVIHVGGSAGGIAAGRDRFLAGFERLSEPARARLAIENDDRAYDLASVIEIGEACGIPVVWDLLHHRCHNPQRISADEALAAALATWPPGVMPKIHYSSPRLDVTLRRRRRGRRVDRQLVLPPLRAHADLIDPIGFERFLRDSVASGEFDIMLEAKAKDLALIRLRDQLEGQGLSWRGGQIMVPAPGGRRGNADRDPKPSGVDRRAMGSRAA